MEILLWIIGIPLAILTYFLIKLSLELEMHKSECRRNHGHVADIFYEASETGEDIVKVYLRMRKIIK